MQTGGDKRMDGTSNTILLGDCLAEMNRLPEGDVDLVFADPPFNIGYDYDVYDDSLEHQRYLDWSGQWISAVWRVLKPTGAFWLAIGDEYAAELKLASQKIGFHCRSWVIWYYTFGVNCSRKFTRSHAHLFHFVKDPVNFTFRDDDLDNRVPSARELVYNDKRAHPRGRLPDDTWIIRPADAVGELVSDDEAWTPHTLAAPSDTDRTFTLRPQDLEHCFRASEDTWYFPRVAGTFKERAGFHGCQMPEQLLGRIIRTCSEAGDLVLDPFSGSATTLAVAKKLGRRFLGFELSEDYVRYGLERLAAIRVGDRLDGSPEPLKSAPRTSGRARGKTTSQHDEPAAESRYRRKQYALTRRGVLEAFQKTHDGFPADRVVADPELNHQFVACCTRLGLVGDARTWNTLLFRLRKEGALAGLDTSRRTAFSWEDCDRFIFASEIAWQMMLDEYSASSLDEVLCDPALAAEFDRIAQRFAPGFTALEYRYGALKLRKQAKYARSRASVLKLPASLGMPLCFDESTHEKLPQAPGVYILSEDRDRARSLYVGETLNLGDRFQRHCREAWLHLSKTIFVHTVAMDPRAHATAGRLAWQSCLVTKYKPRLNTFELRTAS